VPTGAIAISQGLEKSMSFELGRFQDTNASEIATAMEF